MDHPLLASARHWMRLSILIAICLLGTARTASAQSPNSFGKISTAICQVSVDSFDHKAVVLTKSAGSKALDDFVVQSAGRVLGGARGTSLPYAFECRTVEGATGRSKSKVMLAMLRPPYPAQARARHEQGSGVIRATFDESGRVAHIEMTQSTGSKILDSHTLNFASAQWRSSGGAKVTIDLPVDYRLVHGARLTHVSG